MTKLTPITLAPGDEVTVKSTVTPTLYWTDATHTGVRIINPAPVVVPPVDPPPPPPTTGLVYGPGIAIDSKDNKIVGCTGNRHIAFVWWSDGGTATRFALNQRFDADRTGACQGYSKGDGGLIHSMLHAASPTGPELGGHTWKPVNPHTEHEDKRFYDFDAPVVIPPGWVAFVHDNIHADPANNWMSLNCDTPGPSQPAFKTGDMVVMQRTDGGSWSVTGNTPVFDVEFADGHHEGNAFFAVIANAGVEVYVSGPVQVRERFTPPTSRTFSRVGFRVQRISGPGPLTVTAGGQSVNVAISQLQPTTAASLNGGQFVEALIPVKTVTGVEQSVTFSVPTGTTIKVMPIRETGQSDGWGARAFREGVAEKTSGGAWSAVYLDADLQFYLA